MTILRPWRLSGESRSASGHSDSRASNCCGFLGAELVWVTAFFFFFFFLFPLFSFNGSIVDVQYCVSFRCLARRFSYIHVFFSDYLSL